MARLRTRVERAAVLHRQAAAATSATAAALDAYSPADAPVDQYAEQRELAARLRSATADLAPGWLSASLDVLPATGPLGDTAVPRYVRLGTAHTVDDARFPAVVPLLGTGHLAIDADARDPRVAALLRSILLRLVAAATPGSLSIRIVDAACAGETTLAFAGIPHLMPPPVTDHPGLQAVLTEADRWVREPGPPDRYYVLVIASLPELTDGGDLRQIAHLARTGVGSRLHLIVAGWPPPPLTAETTQAPLPYSSQVSLRNPHVWVGDPPGTTYAGAGIGPSRLNAPVYLDPDPPIALVDWVCAELAGTDQPPERAACTPPADRWSGYVAAARRLDTVRRDAAKLVTEQTAVLKRARAELTAARRHLTAQQARIGDILGDGQPVPLKPGAADLGAAEAALGRLAQAAAAHAAAARAGGPPSAQRSPHGAAPQPGPGAHPGTTTGPTPQPGPGGHPGTTTGPTPQPGPGGHPGTTAGYVVGGYPASGSNQPVDQTVDQTGAFRGSAMPTGTFPAGPAPGAADPASPAGAPPHTGPGAPPHTGSFAGAPPTTGPTPVGGAAPATSLHPGAQAAAGPTNAMRTGQIAGPGFGTTQLQITSPAPPGTLPPDPTSGAGGRLSAPPAGPLQTGPLQTGPLQTGQPRPMPQRGAPGFGGPPVSGMPHPAYVNSGAFPVVSAPPHTGRLVPVSGPPAPMAPAVPLPSVSARLPGAALVLIAEARAALSRADAELSDVDARINRSPGVRNAAVYAAYGLLFALVQLPLLAALADTRNPAVLAAVPCGLAFALMSFGLAWLTIGMFYRQPGGQRPPRTPMIGAVLSLLAAAPALFTVMWAATGGAGP